MANDQSIGKVYLVGAGPGDLGLMTLKGKQCVEEADVVVYDYLSNSQMLAWARKDAQLIYAGEEGEASYAKSEGD